MRILLDECLPRKSKQCFPGHDVLTVPDMGWAGITNGKLLAKITGQFDFFVTVDRNLQFQQQIQNPAFGVIILSCKSNKFEDLEPVLKKSSSQLTKSNIGKVITVS